MDASDIWICTVLSHHGPANQSSSNSGLTQTLQFPRQCFWWPSMTQDSWAFLPPASGWFHPVLTPQCPWISCSHQKQRPLVWHVFCLHDIVSAVLGILKAFHNFRSPFFSSWFVPTLNAMDVIPRRSFKYQVWKRPKRAKIDHFNQNGWPAGWHQGLQWLFCWSWWDIYV